MSGQTDLRGPEWPLLQQLMKPAELFSVQAHGHILTSLSWRPDGTRLITGAHDGSLKSWRVEAGNKLSIEEEITPAGSPRVNQLEWLGDGDSFLTAGGDSQIQLHHLQSNPPHSEWTLPGQQFALAENASLLAISSAGPFYYQPGGKVTLWQLGQGIPVEQATFPEPSRAVALSADGRWLAGAQAHQGEADRESGIWLRDLQQPQRAVRVLSTPGPVWSMHFSPEGDRLMVTLFQGSTDVLFFETATGKPQPSLSGHSLRPWAAMFTPDASQIITASADRTLRCWREGREISRVAAAHENEIWCAALHPGGHLIASGDKDGVLKLFPFPLPPERLFALPRFPHFRYSPLVFSADSQSLWLVQKGHKSVRQSLVTDQAVGLPSTSPVVGCDPAGQVWHWDEGTRQLSADDRAAKTWTLPVPEGSSRSCLRAAMASGGRFFFTIHAPSGSAIRLETSSGEVKTAEGLLSEPVSEGDPLKAASISSDGRFLAVATWHELVLHDFKLGETRRFSNDPHWARDIAFSADSRFMATAGINGHIVLRSLPEGAVITTLKGHLEEASGVAFSPDGKTLVSSEIGLGLRFWRLDTLREVLYLRIPDVCENLAFSPGGQYLAVGICAQGALPESASVLVLPCRVP